MPRKRLPKTGSALPKGRWVALSSTGAVGHGSTADDARDSAKLSRSKELTQVTFVPQDPAFDLGLPSIFERVGPLLPNPAQTWLVGGAIRDALLHRKIRDLDFATTQDGLALARLVANKLDAAFYPLDETRGTGRVVVTQPAGAEDGDEGEQTTFFLDFATLRGGDLNTDLAARDFTVNAIALNLAGESQLLDPMGGQADLKAKRLRQCAPSAFESDPVRVLRVIRLAVQLEFMIERETREAAREAGPLLENVSAERVRDEFMKILEGRKPAAALRAMESLGLLNKVVPELASLKDVTQSPPHIYEAWQHTLAVVGYLDDLLGVLGRVHSIDAASEYALGYASARVGRYRFEISNHLEEELSAGRSARSLLFLAALLHDIAKPQTRTLDPDGRIRFFGHETQGRVIAEARAMAFRLSSNEVERITKIIQHHMRPVLLAQKGAASITPRAIYRFFRDTGPAGVDICVLTLADLLGTRGGDLGRDEWAERVNTVVTLLDAYYRTPEQSIHPPALITGEDILALGIPPSKQVGDLLEAVREAQTDGTVTDRAGALDLVKQLLEKK